MKIWHMPFLHEGNGPDKNYGPDKFNYWSMCFPWEPFHYIQLMRHSPSGLDSCYLHEANPGVS